MFEVAKRFYIKSMISAELVFVIINLFFNKCFVIARFRCKKFPVFGCVCREIEFYMWKNGVWKFQLYFAIASIWKIVFFSKIFAYKLLNEVWFQN